METIIVGIITGIVSGLLSSILVYYFTKSRENKYQTYYYLVDYLCRASEDIEMELPLDISRYASRVGDRESSWGIAINDIIKARRKTDNSNLDEEIPEEEKNLTYNILLAFAELNKWAEKNGLDVKNDNRILDIEKILE